MRNVARATAVVGIVIVSSAACSKKREEPAAAVATPARAAASNDCRYESAGAGSTLDINGLVSMDPPADRVREVLRCSGASLQECGGMAGVGAPVRAEVAWTIALDARGLVTAATVKLTDGRLGDDGLGCFKAVLSRLTMPAPDAVPSEIRGVFHLSPRGAGEVASDARFAGATATIAPLERTDGSIVGIERSLDDAAGRLRGCYLMGLENDGTLAGTVDFALDVDGPKVARVTTTAHGNLTPQVGQCVDLVLRNVRIAPENKSRGKVASTITYAKPGAAPAASTK